ncbi:adaptive-response sensory-kinase SasA [Rhodoferax lithotrophicus]|uniref:histidine kinase n=1 Tax=Rhodoferax lithotrophicus TaxID=2798804 RepID=A0ABM7MPB1_9BURK|nr:cache domain-containing protein [Rhodoferax sp. MIZ03]BCO28171.1 adaptive-response sensory-kinase SasA [Rhodoferax sp. MIZ03]
MNLQIWQRRWLHLSVRHKLMVLALLPLVVVLPLLMTALVLWGNAAYDQLLITKVRSDLAVARGYFLQVQSEVGTSTQATANSYALHQALVTHNTALIEHTLQKAQQTHSLDFVNLYSPQGQLLSASWLKNNSYSRLIDKGSRPIWLKETAAEFNQLLKLSQTQVLQLAPHLAARLDIPLVATPNAAPSQRTQEDRALMMLASYPVSGADGQPLAWVQAGMLLNQNLPLIDHINQIVYPQGSLPLGSLGTATLFLDDVRVTTNVRLFQEQRAIGTRVSQAVRQAVLERGETWLDRAFVVNDWYVSAYEPLLNEQRERIGMLYVGYLETPFRQVKTRLLALVIGIFGVAMVLAAWLSLRWARSIFQPVERMNQTMQDVEEGQAAARVGLLPQQDELGALAGHLDHLLDTVNDNTARLQRWNEELDTQVARRTQELQESTQSLQQAQAQLVKSEKLAAIGQLTASVAHEINNPIAVMQGNLDLLRETLGPQARPVAEEISLMDQQIERMRLIVTQLLQYARPNDYAGYVVALDVNDTLASSLVLVEHLLGQASIHVQRDWQASHSVAINRQELQQVLINLMINAIQAMPKGGTLTLRSRDQQDDAGQSGVLIQVCDTGIGLSEQAKERLFSPFFTTKTDGNGLGLWISVGLVERYGGSISAHNRHELGDDNHGAVFGVCLLCEPAQSGST